MTVKTTSLFFLYITHLTQTAFNQVFVLFASQTQCPYAYARVFRLFSIFDACGAVLFQPLYLKSC